MKNTPIDEVLFKFIGDAFLFVMVSLVACELALIAALIHKSMAEKTKVEQVEPK